MHFSEDDLKKALERKDPGAGFTQRVMARVNQAKAEGAKPATSPARPKKTNGALLGWWKLRPAWSFAVVAILLLSFGLGGYQYSEYRHREDIKIAAENQRQLKEAEKARDQAIMALEIARSKLNHVLEHAQLAADSSDEGNDKIRRQRL
ncbi:MAG TPA: hypothetical protein VGN44_00960 [Candidatus Angelobacter sp.]|jgi:hypothetical protein